jgi:hypothetical protein
MTGEKTTLAERRERQLRRRGTEETATFDEIAIPSRQADGFATGSSTRLSVCR